MKKFLLVTLISACTALFASAALAADVVIGIVNVTQLFNDSPYVQKANKTLQDNAKDMEKKVQVQQKKIQSLVDQYNAIKTVTSARDKLQKQILAEQTKLNQMTQDYQQKIRDEQNSGMQQFNTMVRLAVEKVAKEKHINTILPSSSILYTDNTWIDLTKDVQNAM